MWASALFWKASGAFRAPRTRIGTNLSSNEWTPEDLPLEDKPSASRIYDYLLGGYHNFEVDRMAARKITEAVPELPLYMRANRSFLRRVVRYLVKQGVEQFLDIGSGIPTVGNVHEVAQEATHRPASSTWTENRSPHIRARRFCRTTLTRP